MSLRAREKNIYLVFTRFGVLPSVCLLESDRSRFFVLSEFFSLELGVEGFEGVFPLLSDTLDVDLEGVSEGVFDFEVDLVGVDLVFSFSTFSFAFELGDFSEN